MNGEVVLVGATGLLGVDVLSEMRERGWQVDAPSRDVLDLEDPRALDAFFLAAKPTWVVNCASYTAVDDAESDEDRAKVMNAIAPFSLARFSRWVGARFLHVSTDFVFDGKSQRPYRESDEPNPLGAYARSKRHGELLALEENKDMIVVRTAWLFGAHGKCFPQTIIRAGLLGKPLRVVDDQWGSPSYTRDVAVALCNLVDADAPPGIYHVANSGIATWREVALECLKCAGIDSGVEAITTDEWPTPAERPQFSALDCGKYVSLGSDPLPDWKDAVSRFVREALPDLQAETVRE